MHSVPYTYEDEVNNRCLDMEIGYEVVPYSPPIITADPYNSHPAEGGNCEGFCFKVIHVELYDEEGEVVKEDFTNDELEQFALEFEDMFNNNEKLQDEIDNYCTEAYTEQCEYEAEEYENWRRFGE